METEQLYLKFKSCQGVSTDTRNISENDMFFALRGENFDGNKFAAQALEKGARYCVIDDPKAKKNEHCILVSNVLQSLQNLARYHRNVINIPIIGLTGSNGKTTTKELIYSVLNTTYRVKATRGNLNNHIGVPLTLLEFDDALDFGIVEMGANHQKEIEFLSAIAQPDYALITNFGKAHLEGFGGIEGVIKGKSELYDFVRSHNRTAFVNTNDETQVAQIGAYSKIVTFGSDPTNDSIIEFVKADPFVSVAFDGTEIKSQLIGTYNYSNISIAIAIGHHFKVNTTNIKKGIENYVPRNNRSEIIHKGTLQIILDAYNANPTSMVGALNNLKQLSANQKFLFLGDMFELGDDAALEHQAIVDFAEANFNAYIYLIGENFFRTKTSASTQKFKKFEDVIPVIEQLNLEHATVLIKGSRGMALERIVNLL